MSKAISEALRKRRVQTQPLTRADLTDQPFGAFNDWLDRAENDMPEGLRILLALDEYERLGNVSNTQWGKPLLDTFRNWFQHRPRLVLMFTGVHTIEELGPAWTDRFISVRQMRVSFLGHDDVVPLLTDPVPEFDMTYAEGAMEAIFEATHGQPFLTQAVAFELVQHLNREKRKEANKGDIEVAVKKGLVRGSPYFANVWDDAKEDGQAILTALARGETPPEAPKALRWLCNNDVLDENGNFWVPMVKRWVLHRSDTH